MSLSLKIAVRYLFSKKSHSAINIISMVSICGVAVTTMALICTLSVYNGFQDLIASLYSSLDPQIKVIPATGKTLLLQDPSIKSLAEWQEIDAIAPVIEENALLIYRNRQMPVLLKGVPDNYSQVSNIDSILLDGNFFLKDSVANYATIGVGVANRLEVGAHYVYPLSVYTPKRKAKVNLANPSNAFNEDQMFATAVFSVNQPEYDDQMVIVPLDMAAKLFDYPQQASALEIKLKPKTNEKRVIASLSEHLGKDYLVKDRMMQQETSFRMMQIEKWMTFLILAFILMIATFNVIGSLSMLIIDKQNDIKTLQNLGADEKLISRIFLTEGWLISAIGAGTGLIAGIFLCWLQQEYGLLRLGQTSGAFIVDAYPVRLLWSDALAVLAIVTLLGLPAAWYPVKYLRNKWLRTE